MKIIPAIDIMEGNVVRLVKGNPNEKIVYGNDPLLFAKKYEEEGADIIHIVDLDATLCTGWNNNKNNIDIISKIIDSVSIPIQVAGGLRSIQNVNDIFEKKAKKVVIGTMAYKDPKSIQQLSKKYPERIVISIDQNNDMVMIDGWRQPSGFRVIEAIKLFLSKGINEFLLTSVDRDGTLNGPDTNMLSFAASIQNTKIIASGGISSLEDIIRVKNTGCSSVILGKALYDGRITVEKARMVV